MRRIALLIAITAFLISAVASAAAPPDFAGTWALDKSKSQGLGRRHQAADSVTWTITQTDKLFTVDEKATGGEAPAGGGPGGGGRGFGGPMGPRNFNLDGSETSFEMGPAKGTRKASWGADKKTFELVTKTTFQGQEGEVTTTSTDKLQLSDDGKTLTVNRHSEGGRGPQDSTLVFTKQ